MILISGQSKYPIAMFLLKLAYSSYFNIVTCLFDYVFQCELDIL